MRITRCRNLRKVYLPVEILTLKTSDFEPKLSAKIVGAKTVERTVGEDTVKEVVLDDSQNSTYKGFGIN